MQGASRQGEGHRHIPVLSSLLAVSQISMNFLWSLLFHCLTTSQLAFDTILVQTVVVHITPFEAHIQAFDVCSCCESSFSLYRWNFDLYVYRLVVVVVMWDWVLIITRSHLFYYLYYIYYSLI